MLTLAAAYLAVFASFEAVKTSLLFTFFFFSEKTDFNSRFRVKCFKKKGKKRKVFGWGTVSRLPLSLLSGFLLWGCLGVNS